ncbi:coiled-coil domain-containing protein 12 [Patagioenas fasciata monilis]|uniref:Coiled-coil domain-containing protein 12 n=1 Tax=Patagioenas fasciata monilis TaxID=372326 RepID=A0A1V4JQ53_PATFA|nr:coiled-coil domain-containing protein 12 [Patagioenas fasciata monilis]
MVSSLFLLTSSDSAAPFGVFVTTVASVTRDALDTGLDHELLWGGHTICSVVFIGEKEFLSHKERDLKRDVAKKLEKLEKRTQRAIAELIRERLKGQDEELASAVASAKQEGSDSD